MKIVILEAQLEKVEAEYMALKKKRAELRAKVKELNQRPPFRGLAREYGAHQQHFIK